MSALIGIPSFGKIDNVIAFAAGGARDSWRGRDVMPIEIVQQPTGALHGYSVVPISFTVDSRYRVDAVDGGLGGWRLTEERVEPPYVKDYDEYGRRAAYPVAEAMGHLPLGVFAAVDEGVRIGGAVVAWNTPGADMLEGRDDLAVLWDLRVHPDRPPPGPPARVCSAAPPSGREGRGAGASRSRPRTSTCGACKFYAGQGCYLGGHTPQHLRRAPPRGPAALVPEPLMESPAA